MLKFITNLISQIKSYFISSPKRIPTTKKSPCISECFYDHQKDYCTGCYRDLMQIEYWKQFTPAQKKRALRIILNRRREELRQ